MRTCFTFLILVVFKFSYAQDSMRFELLPIIDGKINYTSIINTENLSERKVSSRIKDWAGEAYTKQTSVLPVKTNSVNHLSCSGYFPIILKYHSINLKGLTYTLNIYHTIDFYISKKQLKIVLSDLKTQMADTAIQFLFPERRSLDDMEKELIPLSEEKRKEVLEIIKEDVIVLDEQIKIFLRKLIFAITKKETIPEPANYH
jgi:hypothetical protein